MSLSKIAVNLKASPTLAMNEAARVLREKGEAVIHLEKGRMPQVTFPHHMHQKALDNNCNACHDMFPKQSGIIKEMILQEKLKKKQVMNLKCLKCHKNRKKAGLAAGPTKCTACHVRSK